MARPHIPVSDWVRSPVFRNLGTVLVLVEETLYGSFLVKIFSGVEYGPVGSQGRISEASQTFGRRFYSSALQHTLRLVRAPGFVVAFQLHRWSLRLAWTIRPPWLCSVRTVALPASKAIRPVLLGQSMHWLYSKSAGASFGYRQRQLAPNRNGHLLR